MQPDHHGGECQVLPVTWIRQEIDRVRKSEVEHDGLLSQTMEITDICRAAGKAGIREKGQSHFEI